MNWNRAGFSFVELLASLAILSLLLAVAVPVARTVARRHDEMDMRRDLFDIRAAIDRYKRDYDAGRVKKKAGSSGYPPSLSTLVEGIEDVSSPNRRRIYYLRRIPRNPLFQARRGDAVATWGVRSYESAPEAPVEGDDVFDVYCPCEGSGLDGIPYRDW